MTSLESDSLLWKTRSGGDVEISYFEEDEIVGSSTQQAFFQMSTAIDLDEAYNQFLIELDVYLINYWLGGRLTILLNDKEVFD